MTVGAAASGAEVLHIGAERQPVVRYRNALKDVDAVLDEAKAVQFQRINRHYPGVRAAVSAQILTALIGCVGEAAACFDLPTHGWSGDAWFSMVTTPPDALTPIQRLPHFDGLDENLLAIMTYLSQGEHGGTNFFRHKDTGFETVTQNRFPEYKRVLEAGVAQSGLPPARYIEDGAPLFEKTTTIPADFNTLVVYRGCNLHSGAISNDAALSGDPTQGRLTINGFFHCAAA